MKILLIILRIVSFLPLIQQRTLQAINKLDQFDFENSSAPRLGIKGHGDPRVNAEFEERERERE